MDLIKGWVFGFIGIHSVRGGPVTPQACKNVVLEACMLCLTQSCSISSILPSQGMLQIPLLLDPVSHLLQQLLSQPSQRAQPHKQPLAPALGRGCLQAPLIYWLLQPPHLQRQKESLHRWSLRNNTSVASEQDHSGNVPRISEIKQLPAW